MLLIEFLQTNPTAFIVVAAILGLLVGSFLNVVIHRLPLMMEAEWRQQCAELNAPLVDAAAPAINLMTPRSRCPHCGHAITALENVPVLSYLFLKGKCSACAKPISARYPVIEALSGVLTALVAWHFGWSWQAGAAMLLTWALIALSVIDFDHQLLPDSITQPFIWLGLALSLFGSGGVFVDTRTSLIGALAGYMSLWLVYQLFKRLTGKEGMGYGDFKLFALFGAWLGWQLLPAIILLSSLVGAIVGIGLIVVRGRDRNLPIPFGPYLAAAGWIALLWGERMT
ncbi:MAG: prepilin peptidase, partial [Gammaproteobacteria bacterium]